LIRAFYISRTTVIPARKPENGLNTVTGPATFVVQSPPSVKPFLGPADPRHTIGWLQILFSFKGGVVKLRIIVCSFLLGALLAPFTFAQTAASAPPPGRKKRVAVFDFDYATVQTASAAAFGTNVDVGRGIADLTVKYLVQDGTYAVIERKAMDKILAEQNFSNSDRANAASAAKIGKLLGVDAIVVGSVTQFGNDTQNQKVGGAGGGWPGYGLGGFSHKKSKAIVAVDSRIVNIDTAEINGCRLG